MRSVGCFSVPVAARRQGRRGLAAWPGLLLASALLALGAPLQAEAAAPQPVYSIIVKLKADAAAPAGERESALAAQQRLQRVFAGKSQPLGNLRPTGSGAQLVSYARKLSAAEAKTLVESLKLDPDVEWAAPNVREHRLQTAPDDPDYASQWWLSASPVSGSLGVPAAFDAWAQSTGGTVNVAVLDTGLLVGHPDLTDGDRFTTGYDMVTNESDGPSGDGDSRDADFSDPGDGSTAGECGVDGNGNPIPGEASSWHGSKIASIIGGVTDNAIGVAGVNRRARVISVRVAGPCGALVSDLVDGMRWAAGLSVAGLPLNPRPARVVNISFGSADTDCSPYAATISELHSAGVLVVAAAGNDQGGAVNRPARCGAFAVGAVTRDGAKTSYSNQGAEVSLVTVGGQSGFDGIFTASNTGTLAPGEPTYEYAYGTSFSTPIVSGVASLMLAVNPDLTYDQLVDGLISTARDHVRLPGLPQCSSAASQGSTCNCTTTTCGAGLLDAPAALSYAATAPLPPPAEDDSSGGGAVAPGWLLGLGLSVVLIAVSTRSRQARMAETRSARRRRRR